MTLNSVLDRLVALTIRTGTATATLAVATVIAYLLNEETNVPVGIAFALGRVYVLSMLGNLNVRRSGRSAPESVASGGMSGLGTLTIPSIVTDDFGSGCFHHTVDIDPQQDVTLTGSMQYAKSLGDDSRPGEIEVTASHPPRKQSELFTARRTSSPITPLALGGRDAQDQGRQAPEKTHRTTIDVVEEAGARHAKTWPSASREKEDACISSLKKSARALSRGVCRRSTQLSPAREDEERVL
ncbi:hypothetical protein C8J57DRAFT_1464268 [Mycena rebaudengoi]|nr:hypothetical protein C8J57DRAFT_1464268 [Mycena rebaudengoi]